MVQYSLYSPSKCFGHQVWPFRNSVSQNWLSEDGCLKHRSSPVVSLSLPEKKIIAKSGRVHCLQTPHKWQVESFVAKLRTQRTTRWCRELPFSTRWKKLSGRVDHPQVWRKHLKPNCPRLLEALNRCWDQFWEGKYACVFGGMFLRDDNPDLMVNCMEVQ